MKNQLLLTGLFLIGAGIAGGQTVPSNAEPPAVSFKYTVAAAPEWTALFNRGQGWFGADGIFSIPLSGIKKNNNQDNETTLLLFSDTFIGEVKDGKPMPGFTMVNNSIAYVNGNDPKPENMRFFYKTGSQGKPETFFVPRTSTAVKPQLFWLGDGFVNKDLNDNLYIFGYKVERTGSGAFDFITPEVSLIALPKGSRPPFTDQRQITTPLHIKSDRLGEGNFGAGVLVNTRWAGAPAPDGYVYVYGCIGKNKSVVVARVKPKEFEAFESWRYWDGNGWSEHADALKPITDSASDELSMTPLADGRFLLIFQVMGLSDKVGMRIADSPHGPFSAIKELWTAPEWKEGLWTYNAKAHLNLSKPGELLISYNTIKDDFWNAIQKDSTIYHPRFIKLKFDTK